VTSIFIAAAALVLTALVELAFPGRDLYHYGWFNVVLIALVALALYTLPRTLRSIRAPRPRGGIIAIACAAVIAGAACVASGLLGPDTQAVVAAPGASVRIDVLGGSLVFPIAQSADTQSSVMLARGSSATAIGSRRFVGPFLLQTVPRQVVSVDVTDARGAHLTITQPTGTTFLSPVLLMQQSQAIAGMNLPYDTFAVPAAHRLVKAVLFDEAAAARLPALAGAKNAVLFDIENENEVEVKNGIGVARDGAAVALGGIRLQPHVLDYPAIQIISVPDYRIVALAVVLAIVGLVMAAPHSVRGNPSTTLRSAQDDTLQ
jgi:hypothetical protein